MTTAEALQVIWKALNRPPIELPNDERKRLHALVSRVAARHRVTTMQIMGRCRSPRIVAARQEAYCVLRRVTGMSYPKLGKYFGRCHDTVMKGIDVHEKRASCPRYPQPTTASSSDSAEKVRSLDSAIA